MTVLARPGRDLSPRGRLGPAEREQSLSELSSRTFDVVVVGGGVVGAGAALDAASRGLTVALLEARDWASGTSSRSSKLIHGGLRYLEMLEFGLVREALRERGLILTRLAPHLSRPVPFLFPLTKRVWERAYIGSGVALYDAMSFTGGHARGLPLHRHLTHAQVMQRAPGLRADSLIGAIQYYDAQLDDARHTMALVRTAAMYGAACVNRARVTRFVRVGDRTGRESRWRIQPGSDAASRGGLRPVHKWGREANSGCPGCPVALARCPCSSPTSGQRPTPSTKVSSSIRQEQTSRPRCKPAGMAGSHLPTVMKTARLTLRPPQLDDAPAVFANYASDPEVTRYLSWPTHQHQAQTEAWLRSVTHRVEGSPTDRTWLLDDGASVIGAFRARFDGHRAAFGYVLARAYWRRGLMTEVAGTVVPRLAAVPGVYRVWTVCDIDNFGSARVLEKIGMRFEGVLLRWCIHPNVSNRPRDVRCYVWPDQRS